MFKPFLPSMHRPLAPFLPTAALLLGAASSSQLTQAQTTPAGQHWVQTWASPVVSPSNDNLAALNTPPAQFNNQTLRMITHTSVGGSTVRVRISNVFGAQALNVGAAHVALRDQGANIVAGTDQALTFSGQPSVSIPPGALILSDPVAFSVPTIGDLAVSIFLPDAATPDLTLQPFSHQTTYIASPTDGDASGSTVFPNTNTQQKTGWFFLTGVEVLAPTNVSTFVAFGDSITEGLMSTDNTNHRWPDRLIARLFAQNMPRGVANEGISGNKVLVDQAGPSALQRFDRELLAQSGATHATVLLGINDINGGANGPSLIAGHRQFIARAHDKGVKIIGCTLTPVKGESGYSATVEAARGALNNFIRNSAEYDGLIDFDAATRNPSDPLSYNPAYNSGDSLHPNDTGYQAMGNAIDLTLLNDFVTLSSVVSRKVHGSAGPFDLPLPQGLGSSPAIESRSGGPTGDFQLVFTFAAPITSVLGAAVAEGTGSVASVALDPTHPAQVLVSLTGVTDAQYVTVGLTNVSDSLGNTSSVRATLGVLLGDVNGSGRTDNGDVIAVRNRSVQPVDATNFRFDVNLSGRIDNGDVIVTRNQSVSALPAAPASGSTP